MPAELATTLAPADDAARLLQAESVVRDYCGWHIAPLRTGVTFTTDLPCGRTRLFLPTLQLATITDIDIVGQSTSFSAASWTWDAAGWVEPSAGHFWPTAQYGSRITITFNHGYATVPPSVTRAVQAIATAGVSNPSALRRIQAGPFVDDYGTGGTGGGSVADVLAPYVLPVV